MSNPNRSLAGLMVVTRRDQTEFLPIWDDVPFTLALFAAESLWSDEGQRINVRVVRRGPDGKPISICRFPPSR